MESVNQENLIAIFSRISRQHAMVFISVWLTLVVDKYSFLSAPTLDKLKIWQRQILSRFLVGPNKFCEPSASGPLERQKL